MKFLTILLLFGSCASYAGYVKPSKATAENISAVYLKKLADEFAEIKSFQEKFKADPKTYCPTYTGPDESTCFKTYLQNYHVKSSTEVVLLTTIAASVGLKDGQLGYSQQMTRILMLENVIVLYENLNLNHFHLSRIQPQTSEGKTELKLLKNSDEQMLSGSFKKIEKVLLSGFSAVEKKRSVASVEEWKKKKIGELKARLEKLRKVSWKYPS